MQVWTPGDFCVCVRTGVFPQPSWTGAACEFGPCLLHAADKLKMGAVLRTGASAMDRVSICEGCQLSDIPYMDTCSVLRRC